MAAADVHRGKHANPYPEDEEENDEEDDLAALEEQLEPPVQLDTSWKSVIVVDNTPVVGPEKYEKLVTVLKKIFSALGTLREDGFYLPVDPKTQNTIGFAFVEFARPEDAERAMEQAQDYKLDKSHVFKLTRYEDFERFSAVPDVYQPPEVKPQQEREFLHNWLLDPLSALGHEQYVIRYGDETELYWNNDTNAAKPEPVYHRKHMTETYVKWSPHGTYLASFHVQGIVLWGGPTQISGKTEFSRVVRFSHPGVKLVDFSPCERYMVSISPQFAQNDNPKDPQGIVVWDVRSGKKLRGFQTLNQNTWPAFLWSHDGKYLARLGQDVISVYETPGMDLLDKKSIKAPGAKDLCWSPAEHILSYWVAETGNTPARVVLLDIPSRRERRTQNLFNVSDCRLHWQSKGDYLAVKVDRTTKSKKTLFTSFEFFRLREKDIPVESLELKETVGAVEWEPNGTRLALAVGESARPDVHFYELKNKKLQLLKVLEKKTVNTLVWSPRGTFIVLAGLKNLNGALEFYNVAELESLGTDEHFMATHVEWEPTGRQVATYVSAWSHQFENGYNLWTFQGKLVRRVVKEKFYSLAWRPRPPSKLTAEQEAAVAANLDKFIESQESSDKARGADALAKARAKVEAERADWEAFAAQARAQHKAEKAKRKALRGGFDSDDESQYVVVEKAKRKALRGGFDSDDESQYVVVEKVVEELVEVTEELAK